MRTRTQIYLVGALLLLVSLPLAPVTTWCALRSRLRIYREEMRERNRPSTLLGAEVIP